MNYEIDYKYDVLTKKLLILANFIILILSLIFNFKSGYLFIIKLIFLITNFLIFFMIIIKKDEEKWRALKYIGIGNLFIFFIRFICIELSKYNIVSDTNNLVNILIIYMELINIYVSLFIYRKRNNKNLFINYIFLLLSEIIALIIMIRIFYLKNYKFTIILFLVLLILSMTLFEIKKNKYIDKKLYIVSILMISSIAFNFKFNINNLIISANINYIYEILMYMIFEERLIEYSYISAYEKLNKAKNIKIKLNKKLNLKEKKLKELNLLIRKSENMYKEVIDTFSNGILIFENDMLIYSNYYITIKNISIENGMDISKVLNNLTGKRYENISDLNFLTEEFKIDDDNIYEFYLFVLDDKNKVILLNNITNIIKKREELKSIENIINEENIKEEFYSNISHELRTPINIIYSAIQLNEIYLKNNNLQKIDKNNKCIMQNCLRLIRTINNFIDSNKLTEGYLELNKKYYNLVDIIENVVLLSNFYVKQKNTSLTFDPDNEEIYFYCDKNQIERILLNILSNSLKYGKDNGSIYIIIKVKEKKKIIIEVINDADAIPEEKRKMIFEKFTKIDSSLNRPSEGSGLGLFLTKKLVEMHLGNISLNVGKKKGNIFKIEFPYEKIAEDKVTIIDHLEVNELKEKVNIEFSDIYF